MSQFQADDPSDDQPYRDQPSDARGVPVERDADREGSRRADPGPDRVSGADGEVALGWLVLLYNGMTLGVLINSIAGVSLNTDRLEAFKDRLEMLKAAYRGE